MFEFFDIFGPGMYPSLHFHWIKISISLTTYHPLNENVIYESSFIVNSLLTEKTMWIENKLQNGFSFISY